MWVSMNDLNVFLSQKQGSAALITIRLPYIDPQFDSTLPLKRARTKPKDVLTFTTSFRCACFLNATKKEPMCLKLFNQISNFACISIGTIIHREDIGRAEADLDLDVLQDGKLLFPTSEIGL